MSSRSVVHAGSWRERSSSIDYDSIAKGLGWFSVALGLAETIAPRGIANLIGVRYGIRDRTFLRSPLFGPRELCANASNAGNTPNQYGSLGFKLADNEQSK
jgi:hypothetical protein